MANNTFKTQITNFHETGLNNNHTAPSFQGKLQHKRIKRSEKSNTTTVATSYIERCVTNMAAKTNQISQGVHLSLRFYYRCFYCLS
jgi:hypothetical protein